jgi:two-component system sensor histidine kinase BaeS
VSEGVVVGRLLVAPLPRLREDIDLEFAREQRRHMLWIAAAVLLVCLPLSWLLSRWLLRPVRALADGTRALAAGDYAARIRIDRDDELGALGRDFNALAAALEKHREMRRQWGADIAHELRTPISVLAGEIQALQDGVRHVDAERLASLQAECQRLRALVDDLYQLALSDAGALSYRFEAVDLAQLVREAARTHAGVMRDAGLTLIENAVPATATMARGDAARLRQLLDNLLGNALRYTDRPGQVVIALDPVPNGWRLRIDDSAPGVGDNALPHLFERLYRAEPSRSRRHGGAGLGLSICRNIVEAHGGTITAVHSPEGGLRIELVLPDR